MIFQHENTVIYKESVSVDVYMFSWSGLKVKGQIYFRIFSKHFRNSSIQLCPVITVFTEPLNYHQVKIIIDFSDPNSMVRVEVSKNLKVNTIISSVIDISTQEQRKL